MNNGSDIDSMIISYMTLRKLVGLLGTALPFVLFLGAIIVFRTGLQSSMSGYYHTGMRNVFVGTLCVIGFFLLSYRGHEPRDNRAGNLACLFAVLTAVFPTTPDGKVTNLQEYIGYVHLAAAAAFFVTLIYFSLCLFTKTSDVSTMTARKTKRNVVYKICGYTMAACIVFITIHKLLPGNITLPVKSLALVFWFEAIAVFAFGFSWLTKGEAILGD